MRQSSELSAHSTAYAWQVSNADTELTTLCGRIRRANAVEAKLLPAQVLSYMATSLSRVEIDIHVEECLPMVCEAAHAYVRSMGVFSSRHADCDAVDATRERLIQSLEALADELRRCSPLPTLP